MRYLLRFNLFLMSELPNENQPELIWGNRLLSNFHMKVPRFCLISPSKGRISSSLNKGAACSLPFFDRIILTAFFVGDKFQVSGIGSGGFRGGPRGHGPLGLALFMPKKGLALLPPPPPPPPMHAFVRMSKSIR